MSEAVAARGKVVTAATVRSGPALILIYTMWFFILFEPHWMIPGGGAIQRVIIFGAIPTLLVAIRYGRSRDLYWPLLLFTALHVTAWPSSMNRGLVVIGFIDMARISILFTATVALCRTPERALWILKLFLLSFVWYGLQGLAEGVVGWHPALGNPDGFGGLMVVGIGVGFCAMTSGVPRWRYLGYTCFALTLLCVISSFARGAVVGVGAVLLVFFLRSNHKLRSIGIGIGAIGLLIPVTEIIHPGGAFWREMQTISEGTDSGTGADRKDLWGVAIEVWKTRPIFGVGSHNTGVVASKLYEFGELQGRYAQPGRLYNRAIHNTYFQLLAEQGLVGFGLWIALLLGALRRLRRMRRPEVVAAWNRAVGGEFDLHSVAVGLELAMIGFLVGAFFYNEAYRHWVYTLIILIFLVDRTAPHTPRAVAEPSLAG